MRIAVCSWSLGAQSPAQLVEGLLATGLSACQLALEPLRAGGWSLEELRQRFNAAGLHPVSGMLGCVGEDYSSLETIRVTGGVRPDRHWPANLERARGAAQLARQLDLGLVSFHAGFLPHIEAGSSREAVRERSVMIERLRQMADIFADQGIQLAFETGQERADTLLEVLQELERPNVGINFDPANMLLYDMGDPVEALNTLAPFVRQVHIKDALRTEVPGTWGQEVPAGRGQVRWADFFDVLHKQGLAVDLVIEREAGAARIEDIRAAHALVSQHLERLTGGSTR